MKRDRRAGSVLSSAKSGKNLKNNESKPPVDEARGAGDFMTNEQIDLVKKSFEKIGKISDNAAALFYAKLFDLNPKLRPLFKNDMKEQGRKLMQVITYTVESLDQIETLLPQVRALGTRHVGYGVEDRDYETVGTALLWTFEKALSREFTPKMRDAWAAVYDFLAGTMKEGSRQPAEMRAEK